MWTKIAVTALIACIFGAFMASQPDAGPGTGRFQVAGTNATVWRVDTATGALRGCYRVSRNGRDGFKCFDLD